MLDFINKLIRFPSKIPCDKRIHTLGGVFITSILMSFNIHWFIVLLIVTFIAWFIEFYQLATKTGHYDNIDAIFVVIGSILVVLPFVIKEIL